MQYRAILGHVDLVTAEHRIDSIAKTGLPGQLQQQTQRLVGDPVLRVVEEDAFGFENEALTAFRIGGEQFASLPRSRGRLLTDCGRAVGCTINVWFVLRLDGPRGARGRQPTEGGDQVPHNRSTDRRRWIGFGRVGARQGYLRRW